MIIGFSNLLVVMALPLESQEIFREEGIHVFYTGVGKVNAAYVLTKRLTEYRCVGRALPLVINFGTAGSRTFSPGTLVGCHSFVQHDMDVTTLGFPVGTTPFENTPATLDFPITVDGLPHGICGSGDSFVTEMPPIKCELIDMEAYALAKVCWLEGAQFICVKYVTDRIDNQGHQEWTRNAHSAAREFLVLYKRLLRIYGLPNENSDGVGS